VVSGTGCQDTRRDRRAGLGGGGLRAPEGRERRIARQLLRCVRLAGTRPGQVLWAKVGPDRVKPIQLRFIELALRFHLSEQFMIIEVAGPSRAVRQVTCSRTCGANQGRVRGHAAVGDAAVTREDVDGRAAHGRQAEQRRYPWAAGSVLRLCLPRPASADHVRRGRHARAAPLPVGGSSAPMSPRQSNSGPYPTWCRKGSVLPFCSAHLPGCGWPSHAGCVSQMSISCAASSSRGCSTRPRNWRPRSLGPRFLSASPWHCNCPRT